MGKKPVVAMVGLIWAGMALVGCQNCKNCRNKDTSAPTYVPNNGAPVVKQDSSPIPSVVTPSATAGGAAARPETAKAMDPPGTKGFGSETPAIGTPVSTGSATSPAMQKSLSPNTDARPSGPGQGFDYRSGETPISKSAPADGGFRMPPRPVSQVNSGVPTNSTESLPPISTPSSPTTTTLPTSASSSGGLPQPPVSTLPPLPGSGNGLPAIDSIPK